MYCRSTYTIAPGGLVLTVIRLRKHPVEPMITNTQKINGNARIDFGVSMLRW
jgi:hypothetical protein